MKYTSTKTFHNLPCSHRNWRHPGHCKYIHGYSRSLTFWFECSQLDENYYVVDFGSLKPLKKHLEYMFDHTMLINEDDPEREIFEQLHAKEIVDLRVMKSCGMEGSAEYAFNYADELVRKQTNNRCWVVKVECRENNKNSAIFEK